MRDNYIRGVIGHMKTDLEELKLDRLGIACLMAGIGIRLAISLLIKALPWACLLLVALWVLGVL